MMNKQNPVLSIDWTRPMLAATAHQEDLDKLEYPLWVSPKLDGIRVMNHPEHGVVTRKFKAVPNAYVREAITYLCPFGIDGEVMLDRFDDFNSVQSAVMTRTGTPDFTYHVFDYVFDIESSFDVRKRALLSWFKDSGLNTMENSWRIKLVPQNEVHNAEEVLSYMAKYMAEKYEGIMLRSGASPYKCGRSTLKQQGLLKYKEFADAEGKIIGFEELMHNYNVQTQDAFGLAERSSHQEHFIPGETLGALVVLTQWGPLRIGTGFNQAQRELIWKNRAAYEGSIVTFKYQTFGMKDLPRFPVFKGFRHD